MESYQETLRRKYIDDLMNALEDQVDIKWVPLVHAAIKTYIQLHEAQQQGYRVALVDAQGNIASDVEISSDAGVMDRFVS